MKILTMHYNNSVVSDALFILFHNHEQAKEDIVCRNHLVLIIRAVTMGCINDYTYVPIRDVSIIHSHLILFFT